MLFAMQSYLERLDLVVGSDDGVADVDAEDHHTDTAAPAVPSYRPLNFAALRTGAGSIGAATSVPAADTGSWGIVSAYTAAAL